MFCSISDLDKKRSSQLAAEERDSGLIEERDSGLVEDFAEGESQKEKTVGFCSFWVIFTAVL